MPPGPDIIPTSSLTSLSQKYKIFRVFSCIRPPPDSRALVRSAFDRGAPDDHGAMSVTSGVHHGPEEKHLEVGAPLALTRASPNVAQIPQILSLFTSLRHRVKSDTGSSSEWNDHHREGAKSTSKHSCLRHQRRELSVTARCSPPPRARTRPDLAKRTCCAD